jgi:hypothetical protein
MAAGTKGTQTPVGLAKKPDWFLRQQEGQAKRLESQRANNEGVMSAQGFTQKKDLGGGMTQYTRPEAGGAVGSSFGRMMGGSPQMGGGMGGGGFIGSMGGLEAASMRLADAASARNIREKQAEIREKQAGVRIEQEAKQKEMARDYQIQQKEREIEKLERAIESVGPGINRGAVQESYRQKIQGLKSEIENILRRK